MSAADFDAWLVDEWLGHAEATAQRGGTAAQFADWLANLTGQTIIAENIDGTDVIVAAPDNDT